MKCKLCKTDTNLCNSHIVPEFFYLPMYNKQRKIFEIHPKIDKKDKIHQKGLREYLLCKKCENKLSKNEKYVSKIYKNIAFNKTITPYGKRLKFTNLNYKKFKICYLSILWRMSISSIGFCKDFKLHDKDENKLRDFILTDNPGNVYEYGFLGVIPLIKETFYPDLMLSPKNIRFLNSDTCIVIFGGLLYIFFLNPGNKSKKVKEGFIKKNGNWLITIDDAKKFPFLDKVFSEIGEKIKIKRNGI